MEKEKEDMSKEFFVVGDFDRFHRGEEVTGTLYQDCFAVKGKEGELKILYSDIQYFAHCESPEAITSGLLNVTPFMFGNPAIGALATGVAAPYINGPREEGDISNCTNDLFLVGYYSGSEECWALLQDERMMGSNAFARELSERADTRIIHHISGLMRETGK